MNEPAPLVSVVTPLYNSSAYIEQTLDSLLAQTVQDWESILVDDGSTDDTTSKLKPYLEDRRFRYLEQGHGGIAAARNLGISAARGSYVCLLDHDDRWLSQKLETQLRYADHGILGIVCSDAAVVHGSKRFLYSDWFFPDELVEGLERSKSDPTVDFLSLLLLANFVCASSVMIDRSLFDRFGLLDPEAAPADDYDMWLRCAPDVQIRFVEQPLVEYLVHDTNYSGNVVRLHRKTIHVLRKHRARYRDDPVRLAEFDRALIHYYDIVFDRILSEGSFISAVPRAFSVAPDRQSRAVLSRKLVSGARSRLNLRRRTAT